MKRKIGALEKIDADLANLQHKIKRDPASYRDDFLKQYTQYESHREIFLQAPSSSTATGIISIRDLIEFISHVADCYPDDIAQFPEQLIHILNLHHADLESELREKIVGSLVLLHTLFPILLSTPSKSLRTLLYQKIISDLRTSNANATNHRLNRTIQTVLYTLVSSDRESSKGLWAVKITRELWKRQIWTDSKAVEIMKEATLSDNEKVIIGGVRFFLGGDKEREEVEDGSSGEETVDMGKLKHQMGINKKSKKNTRVMDHAVATIKKKERKKKQPHPLNFSAFHLLHDPQGFAESLFSKHLQNSKSKLRLEQKLLVLQLVSRLIGLHKLTILSFYSYFLKYLTPRQPLFTSFLASLAQASHSLVPPDVLEPLIQKIANEFVSEASAAEVASAGLNAIREICVRQPLAMNDTLLQDLIMYRKSKDKGVVMAAKGLLGLFREVGADMLKKRDRGKTATMELKSGERKEQRFGEEVAGEIEGIELLEQWKEEQRQRKRLEMGLPAETASEEEMEEEDAGDWEVDEDETDDSGGWINVESDEEINIPDSEDDKPAAKKAKLEGPLDDKETASPPKEDVATKPLSHLATTRILTPADHAKLAELRLAASLSSQLPSSRKKRSTAQQAVPRHQDDPLTAESIEGLARLSRGKASKAEKVALAQSGKPTEQTHQSLQAKRQERKQQQGKSTTNREKARKKNFMMTLGKAKGKQKRSLVERGKVLKQHVER
ncbi:Severe Depolymerization of Actin, partial [Sticta canariensis]|nr:Severe Depolymerization of Actin [Sticta canariensis]